MRHANRQPVVRILPVIAALIVTAVTTGVLHAASDPKSNYLTDSPTNMAWTVNDKGDELTFDIDSGREPVIEFNKEAFREGEVSVEVVTDVQTFYFRSGTQRFELRLEADKRYRLGLGGEPHHEVFKLNNKELTYDKPKWVEMIKAEEPKTFTLMFLRAREVTIRIRERGKKVELKLPERK
ncbi:MAG: hypothetical protein GC159_07890 [Phycisphaera sp.]|nr:hypothetical protein [Phycisphaera sp.]